MKLRNKNKSFYCILIKEEERNHIKFFYALIMHTAAEYLSFVKPPTREIKLVGQIKSNQHFVY